MTEPPEPPRRLEYLPLAEVQGAPANPKLHHEATIEASITRFGYVEAVAMDERTGRLVAGHGRIADLRRREASGEPPPEGLIADDEHGWLLPVQRGWASSDDAEAEAYLIASNRTSELGGWDDPELLAMTQRIEQADAELLAAIFDADAMDELRRSVAGLDGIDDAAAWDGMPAFEQSAKGSAAKVVVHFLTDEDADAFFVMLERARKPIIWWPAGDGHVSMDRDLEWSGESTDAP